MKMAEEARKMMPQKGSFPKDSCTSDNIMRIEKELDDLLRWGKFLEVAWALQWCPGVFKPLSFRKYVNVETEDILSRIKITAAYQKWYSKALVIIKQFLPCRLDEFVSLYECKRNRKKIFLSDYRISEVMREYPFPLIGKENTQDDSVKKFCIKLLEQQLSILEAVKERFKDSLLEIKQVLQADLLDSEIDAARELNTKGSACAAGALAGVVLEKHLNAVIVSHGLNMSKKSPGIKDYAQKLKDEGVIDFQTCRFIQSLGSLRDQCCNAKDPPKGDVEELIAGVARVVRTMF